MGPVIRPYAREDLGRVLQLWERAGWLPVGPDGLTVDQAVEVMHADDAVALVAEVDTQLVGTIVGASSAAVGWLYRLVVADEAGAEAAAALVEELEARFADRGSRKLVAVVEDGAVRAALEARGYQASTAAYLERDLRPGTLAPPVLRELGGRMIGTGLWQELQGMEQAKELIERRVILPLEREELAARHAVVPPKAIVLFGPPGTGKTTFAKAAASRLAWPFVEIQPAELGGEGSERQAKLLADTFTRLGELPAAVVFVDEVEDLASIRHDQRKVSPSITNEFLKQIPRLRERPRHLLVCATNDVGAIDPAFLRPGRFDYVLPVGPPDAEARRMIWRRYVTEITDEQVDIEALVAASELFTPADIEFAARKAAQRAFEREHFEGAGERARTEEFLAAIGETRPSLSDDLIASFDADTKRFARY